MNLHSLIEVSPKAKVDIDITEITKVLDQFKNFSSSAPIFMSDQKSAIDGAIKNFNKIYSDLRKSIFHDNEGYLPPKVQKLTYGQLSYGWNKVDGIEVLEKDDDLLQFSLSPRVELTFLRDLADRLGFVILPFDYLNEESYKNESYDIKRNINNFVDAAKDNSLSSYVLAPVQYYDVNKHVHSIDPNLEIYAGAHSATIIAIALNIPMFRSIVDTLSDLRDRVSDIDKRLTTVTTNVKALQTQVDRLEKTIADIQRVQLEERARTLQMEAELTALRSTQAMNLAILDPMLIALPKGISIMDEGSAIIGPCWGPEISKVVIDIMGKINNKIKLPNWGNLTSNSQSQEKRYGAEIFYRR